MKLKTMKMKLKLGSFVFLFENIIFTRAITSELEKKNFE